MILQSVPQVSLDPTTLVGAVGILVLAYVFVRIATFAISLAAERTVRHRIAVKMLLPVFKTVVYAVVAYYILADLVALTPNQLLAISGFLGAAIGFGVKDLFSSLIGGLIIIVERPYQIGDKVQFGDDSTFGEHYGEVVDIGIRSTRVVTPDDTEVVVPNDAVFKSSVANANAGHPEMLVVVEFFVDADAPMERAKTIVEEAMLTSRYVFVDDDRPLLVLEEDRPYYRIVRGKAYVNDPRNEFVFASDVTKRVRQAFSDAGIEKPTAVPADTDFDG